MKLFINKKQWNQFSPKEMEEYQDKVFQYYHKKGFPYFPTDNKYRLKEFYKLASFNYRNLIQDNVIQ